MAQVLLVDDDPDFLEITRLVLIHHGIEVLTVSTREQAMSFLQREHPDVILLDVMMTYTLDGLDMVAQIRRLPEFRDTPILVISSLSQSQVSEMLPASSLQQIQGWLVKPIRLEDLAQKVRELCAR
ncbi:MAG: response regulator [Anaerolineae bacterium]